jgi:hypothetical protein
MNTVFVITDRESIMDGVYIKGIFTTREGAEAAFDKIEGYDLLEIREWPVDRLSKPKDAIWSKSSDD